MDTTFIDQLAQKIISNHLDTLDKVVIVLPNKRAKVFLEAAIKRHVKKIILSPRICSIEELLYEITGIQAIDSVELLFEFYEIYISNTPSKIIQEFEQFSGWAVTLLQDFNEIDRYLLDSDHVLGYLKDIEDIKHWSLDVSSHTPMITNYLSFFERLTSYYSLLYKRLLAANKGYQGLIYRESISKLDAYSNTLDQSIVFAGFNALNAAEEVLFQKLLADKKAVIYWDIDKVFLDDRFHDAGYFARKIISNWKYYTTNQFEGITNQYYLKKDVSIIGTPKSVGQVKIVGSILDTIDPSEYSNTAIILGDENLLEPLLNALPDKVAKVNITMGLPAKNNPVQVFFDKLFRLHINAQSRTKGKGYVYYYKELQDVLSHPIVATVFGTASILNLIRKQNISFITSTRLAILFKEVGLEDRYLSLFFSEWETKALPVLDILFSIISVLKTSINKEKVAKQLTQVYLYTLYKVFIQLKNYFDTYTQVNDLKLLYNLYKQAVQQAEVSFEGEPLGGLQIMGVLESRTLDFKNIIITSLNEGTLPAGKTSQSFIPYDVKQELGLPTYKEKDAIYTYHFYHTLTRAKKAYLLYNTESEGLDAGEKSRFITQLEIEPQKQHQITHEIYAPQIPSQAYTPVVITKSVSVMDRLKSIARQGFSPSALTNYLRNPIQFYYQKVLGLSESDEVEEEIAINTLGTIIHKVLEELYTPYINQFLSLDKVSLMRKKVEYTVQKQFNAIFLEGDIANGKNLIAFEVAKRNVSNFLNLEEKLLKEGDTVKIIALEEKLERTIKHSKLPYDVVIRGEVDRIEERNGVVRIIDYKTGKVEPAKLQINDWDSLLSLDYDKVIQLLAYAFLYATTGNAIELEAGIISFKNLSQGFMPYAYKEGKEKNTVINAETITLFITSLVELLNEILDENIPFEERTN